MDLSGQETGCTQSLSSGESPSRSGSRNHIAQSNEVDHKSAQCQTNLRISESAQQAIISQVSPGRYHLLLHTAFIKIRLTVAQLTFKFLNLILTFNNYSNMFYLNF